MKKNIFRIFLLAVCVVLVVGSLPAGAIIPYSTYTYDIDGEYVESPHAYVPYEVIDSKTIGNGVTLTDPTDICVDRQGNIYIADGKGQQVVVVDKEYNYLYTIGEFVNEWGVPDSLDTPASVFVYPSPSADKAKNETEVFTSKTLYIADSTKNRVLVFDITNGEPVFTKTVYQPESEVFNEDHIFKPIGVAVDNVGRMYVVGEYTNQGIISINPDGTFFGFIGAQVAKTSVWDIIWRNFQTKEQRRRSTSTVATEFNNINIDEDGFIYATTSSISASDQQQAITSKSTAGTYAPVKKLSPDGTDVMKRTGFYPPSGEVKVNNTKTAKLEITGPSTIIDVALGPDGMWSIIDAKRQRVFTYDEEGRLLFAFGDKGNQLGNIQQIKAIDYQGTNMLLLDSQNKNITVLKRTSYGDLLDEAILANRERRYSDAEMYWQEILQRNSNFDMSYVGIGKALYREANSMADENEAKIGVYEEAMSYYKYAYDTANYSDAYKEVRKLYVQRYIVLIPIIIIVICICISKFFKYAAKVNLKGQSSATKRTLWREFIYGVHTSFHPFDGFWDIKHEHRASAKGATLILVITIISYIYQSIGRGYVMEPNPEPISLILEICSILLPVILWTVANWCLTTLFDGEGSLKDIYVTTCYALFPLPAFIILTTFCSNFITTEDVGFITMFIKIAYVWVAFLLFFGMMVIHDYSLFKNVVTTLGSIVGMAFIMFIGVLFSTLIGKVFSFIYNIYVELSYRM